MAFAEMRKMKPTSIRKIVFRILGGFAVIGILIIIGFFLWLTKSMDDMCGNTEVSTTHIPGTEYKVVVFQRDCGATTGDSTQASIIKTSQKLKNEGGNIFSADDDHGAAPAGPRGARKSGLKFFLLTRLSYLTTPRHDCFGPNLHIVGLI